MKRKKSKKLNKKVHADVLGGARVRNADVLEAIATLITANVTLIYAPGDMLGANAETDVRAMNAPAFVRECFVDQIFAGIAKIANK